MKLRSAILKSVYAFCVMLGLQAYDCIKSGLTGHRMRCQRKVDSMLGVAPGRGRTNPETTVSSRVRLTLLDTGSLVVEEEACKIVAAKETKCAAQHLEPHKRNAE